LHPQRCILSEELENLSIQFCIAFDASQTLGAIENGSRIAVGLGERHCDAGGLLAMLGWCNQATL
jgi:hypothetical protein